MQCASTPTPALFKGATVYFIFMQIHLDLHSLILTFILIMVFSYAEIINHIFYYFEHVLGIDTL